MKDVITDNYKLLHGDCLERMKEIPDGSVDLTVTSPPYDDLRSYNGNNELWNEQVWKNVITELYRVTKQGGVVVWVVGDATVNGSETGTSFRQALWAMECGFNLHDTMIYEKNTSSFPASSKSNRYTQIFEYMFVFSKGKPKANLIKDKENKWAGYTNWGKNTQRNKDGELVQTEDIKPVPQFSPRNNIWRYVVGGGFGAKNKIAYKHPATFPEKLAKDHILSWSNKGDTVLDCFMGSGTTGAMAIETCREFIGIELDSGYFDIGAERMRNHIKNE